MAKISDVYEAPSFSLAQSEFLRRTRLIERPKYAPNVWMNMEPPTSIAFGHANLFYKRMKTKEIDSENSSCTAINSCETNISNFQKPLVVPSRCIHLVRRETLLLDKRPPVEMDWSHRSPIVQEYLNGDL